VVSCFVTGKPMKELLDLLQGIDPAAWLQIATILLAVVNATLLFFLWRREPAFDLTPLEARYEMQERAQERFERVLREEMARNRQEASLGSRRDREEMGLNLKGFRDSLIRNVAEIASLQQKELDIFADRLSQLTESNDRKFSGMRETLEQRLASLTSESGRKLDQMREETTSGAKEQRQELSLSLKSLSDSLIRGMGETGVLLTAQMDFISLEIQKLTASNENKLESIRNTVALGLKQLQEDNSHQLDRMRATVDEKLQGTLEKRLGESFKQVSERLEQVHKGLGEMQSLASGVGDLKRALTNVKTRGGWGEIQLAALLEEILAPDQYERNVKTREASEEMVEFAIKLPGREDGDKEAVWLPIDAKFPMEDYQRLLEAQERADSEAEEAAGKMLSTRIRGCARDICDKYISPPRTTDFGIMFLPTEGLYAEVVRRPGLCEAIQRECRVVIAGPTTFAALLNSLQMGFRTLAIQKRSSEVWKLLGAVKTEFGRFGEVLDGVRKKLEQASNTMDGAARRSRAIERKLRSVEELPAGEAQLLLETEEN
jgi:DNA recombination protein RmuC